MNSALSKSLISFTVAGSIASTTLAEIRPVQTYNGINRPFFVSVAGSIRATNQVLVLYEGASGKEILRAPCSGGRSDLARVIPNFWKVAEKSKGTLYLQLMVEDKPKGPALVLQPMTNSPVATLDEKKNPKFSPDEDNIMAGYRAWADQDLILATEYGDIRFRLRPDVAPNTVWNIMQLVSGGYFKDVIWHRIVAKHRSGFPFVIQGGDPTGTGMGSPGYSITLEPSALPHDFGVLGMARSTDPNTAGSQFYVALSRQATQHLDNRYTTFAQAISGAETIVKISLVKTGAQDRPDKPPVIKNAFLRPAAPFGTAAKPVSAPVGYFDQVKKLSETKS